MPRITQALVAASRITCCVRVISFIAASLARRGAWHIGRRGLILWRARSYEIAVAIAVARSRLTVEQASDCVDVLAATRDIELAVDVAEMRCGGLSRDEQRPRDLPIGEAAASLATRSSTAVSASPPVIASWLGARSGQPRARLVGDPPRARAVGEIQRSLELRWFAAVDAGAARRRSPIARRAAQAAKVTLRRLDRLAQQSNQPATVHQPGGWRSRAPQCSRPAECRGELDIFVRDWVCLAGVAHCAVGQAPLPRLIPITESPRRATHTRARVAARHARTLATARPRPEHRDRRA